MATSGTYSFTTNRDFIVQEAFRKIGRCGDFETIAGTSDPRLQVGINALNPLVKALHADGMPLWKIVTQTYPMSSWFNLAVDTPVSIGPSMTINQIDKPLKVVQALRRDNTSGVDVPMNIYTFEDFERLSYKNNNTQGAPIHVFYQPIRTTGLIKLWPQPDTYWNTNGILVLRYQQPFQDFNAATDEPDFPVEWHEALILLLATRIAPNYGVPIQEREMLNKMAKEAKDLALSFGTEEGSLFLFPQHRWH